MLQHLRERPDDPKALIVKGDALFRSGRREEASEVFDDLVRVNPKNAKVWLDRARIRKTMDDYPEALRSYDAALAIDETLADGWYKFDINFSDSVACRSGADYLIVVTPPPGTYVAGTSQIIPPPASDVARGQPNTFSAPLNLRPARLIAST